MMNHFRISMAASMAASVISGFLLAIGIAKTWPAIAIASASICLLAALLCIWRLTVNLLNESRTFVKALEMRDYSIRFQKCRDRNLNELRMAMNRIVEIHRDGTNALETRKLYYDRILRVLTHELRNGTTPIVSLTEDIIKHPERYSAESIREAISLIRTESLGIKKFLDSYYELTHVPHPELNKIKAMDFFTMIDRTMRLTLQPTDESADIITYNVAKDMEIEIDPVLMKRVIVNMLKNAVEATAGNPDGKVEVTASMPEGHPHISISDNGRGIDSTALQCLFQPFFSTKSDGNGIGLCLSRQIVRLHGGDIRVSSSPKGTTFHISLPTDCHIGNSL